MIPEFTFKQLETLSVAGHRPLVICDVDEVVVHFTRAFEDYLARRELRLDTSSFALNGNIRHRSTDAAVATEAVTEMVDDFFHQHTAELDAIDGAAVALRQAAIRATGARCLARSLAAHRSRCVCRRSQ